MDAELIRTITLAVQAISLALIGYLSLRIRTVKRDVQTVKHEVKNDHKTNLRDEQDNRHDENKKALAWIGRTLVDVQGDIGWLRDMAIGNRSRIRDLENTVPPGSTRREYRDNRPIQTADMPLPAHPWENS